MLIESLVRQGSANNTVIDTSKHVPHFVVVARFSMHERRRQSVTDVDVPLKKSKYDSVTIVEAVEESVTRHFAPRI